MDILIKSFNRPYYLDRCIQSVLQNVKNNEGRIVVLDDGTPERYLKKIQEQYPQVVILKSNFYEYKANNLNQGLKEIIPIDFWVETAKTASDFFLLLEDDYWVTETLDLAKAESFIKQESIVFMKFFWLGNSKLKGQVILKKNVFFSIIRPALFTWNSKLYWFIFQFNRFKIKRVLGILGIYSKEKALAYYTIYGVAGGIFKKEYFVNLWNNHKAKVDEGLQIVNALNYFARVGKKNIAQSNEELLQTGFMTSATPSHKKYENVNLDVFECNRILNEAWYNNNFNTMANFPLDLSEQEIVKALEKASESELMISEWRKWMTAFKNQYRSFGCKVT